MVGTSQVLHRPFHCISKNNLFTALHSFSLSLPNWSCFNSLRTCATVSYTIHWRCSVGKKQILSKNSSSWLSAESSLNDKLCIRWLHPVLPPMTSLTIGNMYLRRITRVAQDKPHISCTWCICSPLQISYLEYLEDMQDMHKILALQKVLIISVRGGVKEPWKTWKSLWRLLLLEWKDRKRTTSLGGWGFAMGLEEQSDTTESTWSKEWTPRGRNCFCKGKNSSKSRGLQETRRTAGHLSVWKTVACG